MAGGFEPGTILAERYKIVRLIAEGGIGAVYEAVHLVIGKRVAVKVLLAEFQDQTRAVSRFLQEARAACMIEHDNVVNLIDIDRTPDGTVFLVMEYLVGRDLAEAIAREGRLSWHYVQRIGLQICAALEAAHDRGIVHRDLKPSNCFIIDTEEGEVVKVLDFGLAKVLESGGPQVEPHAPSRETVHDLRWLRTDAGEVFGTLACMAPEHLARDPHDHRVDVYAVGMILYEMLTGALPFAFEAPEVFVQNILFTRPEPPSRRVPEARIPADFDALVMRALEKRPDDRFPTMRALGEALLAVRVDTVPEIAAPKIPIAERRGPDRRRGWTIGAGLVGIGALALVLRGALAPDEPPPPRGDAAVASAVPVAAPPTEPPPAEAKVEPPPAVEAKVEPPPEAKVEPAVERPSSPSTRPKAPKTPTPTPTPTPPSAGTLPTVKLSPAERRELLAPHVAALETKCKRPHHLEKSLLVLQITMEGTRVTDATLSGEQGADREAAAKCISKYLRAQVKAPRPLVGASTFSYTF